MTVKEIILNNGYKTIVDEMDYLTFSKHKWHARESRGKVYACRAIYNNGEQKILRLSREVLGNYLKLEVDHINGDTLDNRMINLREANRSQNMANMRNHNPSGFKGITPIQNKWRAQICFKYRKISLGTFETKEQAAKAYDCAARKYFGEFAHTNFQKGELN